MKITFVAIALGLAVALPLAHASKSTRGYVKKDGTYVAPYQSTSPNSTKSDNWSTKGNTNPYTGKPGTKSND